MLRLKLNHVSKRGHRWSNDKFRRDYIMSHKSAPTGPISSSNLVALTDLMIRHLIGCSNESNIPSNWLLEANEPGERKELFLIGRNPPYQLNSFPSKCGRSVKWVLGPFCGPFYKHGLTLIPAWISNHIHHKVWDEITYPFLNFNGATVEV